MEQINKSHGRIERIKGRLIQDTSFLYEKLGLESIYGSIARIGVIEKKTVQTGTGEISHSRQIVITNLEELDIENLVKIRQGALEYRDAALAVRCAIKGRPENRAERRSHDKWSCIKKILPDDEEI